MTDQTVKEMAKELAGVFYEDSARTPGFRKAFPTFQSYMRGQWHQPDGSIKAYLPGWKHHMELARKVLSTMLGQPDARISPFMKEKIFDGLIADRNQSFHKAARQLHQAGMSKDG